jgi:hypothetical protein
LGTRQFIKLRVEVHHIIMLPYSSARSSPLSRRNHARSPPDGLQISIPAFFEECVNM